jgi:hypothetical protein
MEIIFAFTIIGILHFLRVVIYYVNDRNSQINIEVMPELAWIGFALFLGVGYLIAGFPVGY